jgi:hypothetical protein
MEMPSLGCLTAIGIGFGYVRNVKNTCRIISLIHEMIICKEIEISLHKPVAVLFSILDGVIYTV